MGLQNLAIIFIIIILPISLVLNSYIQSQIDTLDLQIKYDRRLSNSTHDSLVAFQLNTLNSDTSDLANSKLRDIEASVNVFFSSIATNFNMEGYNKEILKEYVPALVYTMYDGYYIYSPYTNTLDKTPTNEVVVNKGTGETKIKSDAEILNSGNTDATYHEGDKISGLKPYIYYSCRYKQNNGNDFVITYSLDNYITIQGLINIRGELTWVNDSGYLLDNISGAGSNISYRGISIEPSEQLFEYVYDPDEGIDKMYEYIEINGVKYYIDENNEYFTILNNVKYKQGKLSNLTNNTAIEYYKDAMQFKERIKSYGLDTLKASDAVSENGATLYELDENGNSTGNPKFGNYKIFDFGGANLSEGSIEDPESNFNMHRLAVIRYCIEKELSIAIANYNNYTPLYTNFQMPKLDETEWERIIENVSVISFLQGLNIGGRIYNGHCIITNTKNEEVVQEDSIYLLTNDNEYHRVEDKDLVGNNYIKQGFSKIDFEIKSVENDDGDTILYMPQQDRSNPIIGCYSCIINTSNIASVKNYYEYVANQGGTLATKYFTALGRERYGQYRTNNNSTKLKAKFGIPT